VYARKSEETGTVVVFLPIHTGSIVLARVADALVIHCTEVETHSLLVVSLLNSNVDAIENYKTHKAHKKRWIIQSHVEFDRVTAASTFDLIHY